VPLSGRPELSGPDGPAFGDGLLPAPSSAFVSYLRSEGDATEWWVCAGRRRCRPPPV